MFGGTLRGTVLADDGDIRSAVAEAGAATALADATVAQIDADNTRDGIGPDPAAVLDECREFLAKFIDATAAQLDVMTLWAAHTHGLQAFPATPRLLLAGEMGSGKSESLARVGGLSANQWDGDATPDALRSKLACPPDMKPTIIIDEISDVFGKSGRAGAGAPIGKVLRKGYKQKATQSFSVNRVAEQADIFTAAGMAGRGVAVPDDIRSRCLVIKMQVGHPRCDYTVREHDPQTDLLRDALSCWVRGRLAELERFRAKGLHPKLTGRRREIWEPLLACAAIAGGNWPRRALSAFLDLAIDQADQPVLTPKQTAIRDIQLAAWKIGTDPVPGRLIVETVQEFRSPLYEGMSPKALADFIADAMRPVRPERLPRHICPDQARGYWLRDIDRIAAQRLPKEPDTPEDEDEDDLDDTRTLFDGDADDLDDFFETGETGVTGVTSETGADGEVD
jgi:hypothetical protein